MKLRDAWIAWSPRGGIKVGALKGEFIPPRRYIFGGMFESTARARGETTWRIALHLFQSAVMDGVSPDAVHRELQKIDEYREATATVPGLD
jgi:hypothetical protein